MRIILRPMLGCRATCSQAAVRPLVGCRTILTQGAERHARPARSPCKAGVFFVSLLLPFYYRGLCVVSGSQVEDARDFHDGPLGPLGGRRPNGGPIAPAVPTGFFPPGNCLLVAGLGLLPLPAVGPLGMVPLSLATPACPAASVSPYPFLAAMMIWRNESVSVLFQTPNMKALMFEPPRGASNRQRRRHCVATPPPPSISKLRADITGMERVELEQGSGLSPEPARRVPGARCGLRAFQPFAGRETEAYAAGAPPRPPRAGLFGQGWEA